ncbi:MAG: zinc-ribbon domain-containing protein [Alphaproteobacteria bacterium]|nr:zinc-ribbon domain-containing protein [Alphaproteobacteria bacterium]
MIVTCPHCSKRYMLDEGLLPPEGRQVRCIACHHVWRQIPDIILHTYNSPFIGGADLALQMSVSSVKQSSWVGWMSFFGILILCTGTLIFGRNWIVTHWPKGEKYYELVGFPVTLPGSGLSIANASSQIHQEGAIEMIRVMGNVTNISDSVRAIPYLKIKLMGDASHHQCLEQYKEEGCILDQWEHRLSAQSLLPGEKIQFETAPRPKVEGSQHIRVEF